ncbi:MAG: hypothetical protein COW71_10495 [Ignavibacteriales bacterium CG18_big_fil_WC_8_21_14_2_50_31_20]|nr:MAG: hypothetical protein COW71_10495 [Ignavibacteriales bacterium CG18_big_fil_WC_8_21_14_2_50_31_20]
MNSQIITRFKNIAKKISAKLEESILSDKSLKCKVVYGPVKTRRLGLVLGINNAQSKTCSYNCVYCPSGKTSCCSTFSNSCLSPYELYISVKNKLEEIKRNGQKVEYILFAGSGDPALDPNLSKEISLLREFGYKIAVYTNSSLIWNENIQENLMFADYVSLKVDTVSENTWSKLNRPHPRLRFKHILNGIEQFSKRFRGTLSTETTLVKDINDSTEEIHELSNFLNNLKCKTSYFLTPSFPPTKSFAVSPEASVLEQLSGMLKEKLKNAVLLCCPETEEFFATGDFENELMGLLSLHPVRVDSVKHFVKENTKLDLLENLIDNQTIKEITYSERNFYVENIEPNLSVAS